MKTALTQAYIKNKTDAFKEEAAGLVGFQDEPTDGDDQKANKKPPVAGLIPRALWTSGVMTITIAAFSVNVFVMLVVKGIVTTVAGIFASVTSVAITVPLVSTNATVTPPRPSPASNRPSASGPPTNCGSPTAVSRRA